MNPRTAIAASVAIVSIAAAALADPSAPDALERAIRSGLHACFERTVRDAAKDNLLAAPGLKSCYFQASQAWQDATTRIRDRLAADETSPCGRAIAAIEQEWNGYSAKVLALESVQGMAINTDDDLELAMRKHLYELTYALSINMDCPR
jgi:hypothetical protein